MSDIKLFHVSNDGVEELIGQSVAVEKELQNLIEQNLEALLGIRLVKSEYSTGKEHGGRIDTLGIDENGFPVIIEYKRTRDQNIMTQGLSYLRWLRDHKGDFERLVSKRLGHDVADNIEWEPRILCIAASFNKFDEDAVHEIDRNIELIRYRIFPGNLFMLEQVNGAAAQIPIAKVTEVKSPKSYTTVIGHLENAPPELQELFYELEDFIQGLGNDVDKKTAKYWFAYKRIKNFACVEIRPQSRNLLVFVKVNPDDIELEEGFTRNVRNIGHFGTGDLEIRIANYADLEKAQPLIAESYEVS